jgi:hypothetical protein
VAVSRAIAAEESGAPFPKDDEDLHRLFNPNPKLGWPVRANYPRRCLRSSSTLDGLLLSAGVFSQISARRALRFFKRSAHRNARADVLGTVVIGVQDASTKMVATERVLRCLYMRSVAAVHAANPDSTNANGAIARSLLGNRASPARLTD